MRRFILIFMAVLFVFGLIAPACQKKPLPVKNTVLVTASPYKNVIDLLSDKTIPVEVLVPPKTSPHAFEPTPKHLSKFTQGKVWLRIGEPFEEKMAKAISPKTPIAILNLLPKTARPIIEDHHDHPHHGHHHHEDLHFWLNPRILKEQIPVIAKTLQENFPEKASLIAKNAETLLSRLDELDLSIQQKLAPFSGKNIFSSHKALTYFCDNYALSEVSLETEGLETTPLEFFTWLSKTKEAKTHTLFLPEGAHLNTAKSMQKKLGLKLVMIDPYEEDYFQNMEEIAQQIALSLTDEDASDEA